MRMLNQNFQDGKESFSILKILIQICWNGWFVKFPAGKTGFPRGGRKVGNDWGGKKIGKTVGALPLENPRQAASLPMQVSQILVKKEGSPDPAFLLTDNFHKLLDNHHQKFFAATNKNLDSL